LFTRDQDRLWEDACPRASYCAVLDEFVGNIFSDVCGDCTTQGAETYLVDTDDFTFKIY
jgi:hypothetical protein